MAATGLTAPQRCFPRLHAVHATLVGEDEQAVFAETRRDQLWSVLCLGGDALQPTSTAILGTEGFNRRVTNVVVFAQRDHDGSLFDEILTVHGQRHRVDERASLIAVSVHKFCKFILENRQPTRPRREDVFKIGNHQLEFLMFVLDLGDVKTAELVQAAFCNGLGLCLAEIERVDARHGFIPAKNTLKLFTA